MLVPAVSVEKSDFPVKIALKWSKSKNLRYFQLAACMIFLIFYLPLTTHCTIMIDDTIYLPPTKEAPH